MSLTTSAALANAQLDAITTAVGANGLLRIYTATRPASPDTAITTQTLLVTLTCSATFAAAASGGTLTPNAITGAAAVANGTAAWWRLLTSGGTAVLDGTVTATGGGGDLELPSVALTIGGIVAVTSAALTIGG